MIFFQMQQEKLEGEKEEDSLKPLFYGYSSYHLLLTAFINWTTK